MKDLAAIQANGLENITAGPVGDDIFHWNAVITGPAESPYQGGKFKVCVNFPYDYPLKPPKCVFETRIYHPNVGPHGEICLDLLSKSWTPVQNISNVLVSLYYLLCTPDPDDALSADIAAQFKKDREEFTKTAREWTEQYAHE